MSSTHLDPDYVRKVAERHGVDGEVLVRLLKQENGLKRSKIAPTSPKGAKGPAQFMPATAEAYGVNLNDGKDGDDVDGAARYLADNLKTFGGDYRKAVAAYNAGAGAVQKYGGVPPYAETQAYVQAILGGHQPARANTKSVKGGKAPTGGGAHPSVAPARGSVVQTKGVLSTPQSAGDRVLLAMQVLKRRDQGPLDLALGMKELDARDNANAVAVPGLSVRGGDAAAGGASSRAGAGARKGANGHTSVQPGGGWGGAEGLAKPLGSIAAKFGTKPGSTKRTPEQNAAVGGSPTSDHLTTNKAAYATDFPISGARGYDLARAVAAELGVGFTPDSYASGGTIKTPHGTFRVQILYGSKIGHGDHVHVGFHKEG